MLPRRVVAWIVAVAGVDRSPSTRKAAEMPPCRELNLAVGAPIIMLRFRRGLRPVWCPIIVCKMEKPEGCGANGSSNQEPGGQRVVRIKHPTSDVTISQTSDGFEYRGHVYAISWNAGWCGPGGMHVSRMRSDYDSRRSGWPRVSC